MTSQHAMTFYDAPPPAAPSRPVAGGLTGTVDGVIYRNDDNGYTVLSVSMGSGYSREEVKCVGTMLDAPIEGLQYEFAGDWAMDPKFGKQYKFTTYTRVRPSGADNVRAYLRSGIITGIGPKLADEIVKVFGEGTMDALDECNEDLLRRVPGIGAKKAAEITEQWSAQEKNREVLMNLMGLGVTQWLAVKIIHHFERAERDPWQAVQQDPYCLTEMFGVGFLKADAVAARLGIEKRDPRRLRAGLVYTLQQARDGAGHCYLPGDVLTEQAATLCKVAREDIAALLTSQDLGMIAALETEQDADGTRYWLPETHAHETTLARRMRSLLKTSAPGRKLMEQETLQAAFEDAVGYRLTEQQIAAVYGLLTSRVGILTGGPGTGKTAITRAIVLTAEKANMRVALASPTGRAAKRLEEMTGHEASTLHRLLGWAQSEHKFMYNADSPLEADLVIVDEASMVDVALGRALVDAIDPHHTQLVFVGDRDQLPSVGPGAVLNDLIATKRPAVFELTQIMRQAEGSGIVTDAHRINHGEMPTMDYADCTFVKAEETETALSYIRALAKTATDEVQVLAPMKKGPLGTGALNRMLQAAINPPTEDKPQIKRGKDEHERIYRLGDRVIQTKNDYDRGVMNGDIGRISHVDTAAKLVVIEFAAVTARYGAKDLDEVDLAYALTIHKSQGSEYPQVVIVCAKAHYIMLQRNLLYTALTRARERATIVGEMEAVKQCVRNDKPTQRFTRLRERVTA